MAGSLLCLELEVPGSEEFLTVVKMLYRPPRSINHATLLRLVTLRIAPMAPNDPPCNSPIRLSYCTVGVQEMMPLLIQHEGAFVVVL